MQHAAQMRSRTIAGGARDSLSRQQSGAAVFAPHRSARGPVFGIEMLYVRQSYPTGTWYSVLRRSSYPPNFNDYRVPTYAIRRIR